MLATDPHATMLTLNTIKSVPWARNVTVTGKLTDNDASGAGVGGATIWFDGTGADNLPDNVITNADGTFTVKGASPSSVATGWTVQAHFAGDSDYAASNSATKTYNTVKHSVYLGVLAVESSVPWGQPTTFTVLLRDYSISHATAIEGKTIHVDGSGVIDVADLTTNANGKARGTGKAPDTVATGWTYQAHFAGDSLYYASDSPIKTYDTVKHSVILSLNLRIIPIAPGESYKVTGYLKDATVNLQPLSSKTITFTADDPITIPDKTTITTGYYSSRQAAPSGTGTYNIQSHFAGDSLYNAKDSPVRTLIVTPAP